jgi:glycosyltransferase involved in cell wall biosynthesis
VAPSRFESFGLIFLEAMMYGKPTIGCDVGGIPEVVIHKETGLLAAPGSVASLAACLDTLISQPELRRAYGAQGRRRYLAMFRPEAVVTGIETLMRQAAEAHRKNPGRPGREVPV